MKTQIATTIEQSRRLLACGVDPKTADMVLLKDEHGEPQLVNRLYDTFTGEFKKEYCVPAWSLSALLGLLPQTLMEGNRQQYTFRLIKCKRAYIIDYDGLSTSLHQTNGATLIEACVRMIEWLTANGYSLNKTEKRKQETKVR